LCAQAAELERGDDGPRPVGRSSPPATSSRLPGRPVARSPGTTRGQRRRNERGAASASGLERRLGRAPRSRSRSPPEHAAGPAPPAPCPGNPSASPDQDDIAGNGPQARSAAAVAPTAQPSASNPSASNRQRPTSAATGPIPVLTYSAQSSTRTPHSAQGGRSASVNDAAVTTCPHRAITRPLRARSRPINSSLTRWVYPSPQQATATHATWRAGQSRPSRLRVVTVRSAETPFPRTGRGLAQSDVASNLRDCLGRCSVGLLRGGRIRAASRCGAPT